MSMIQLAGTVTSLNNTADYELIGDTVIAQQVDMTNFTGSFNVADNGTFSLAVYPAFSGILNFNTYSEGGVGGTIHYRNGIGTEKFNIADGKLFYSSNSTNFSGVVSGSGKFAFENSTLTVTGDAFGDGVNVPFSGNVVLGASQTLNLKYIVGNRTWDCDDYLRKSFGLEGSGTVAVPWFSYDTNGGRNGPYFLMGDLTNFTGPTHAQYTTSTDFIIGGGTAAASANNVYAGGNAGTVFGNTQISLLAGGTVSALYGGGNTGPVTGNTRVVVNGGVVQCAVYGGGQESSATIANTEVTISGGSVNGVVCGGGNAAPVSGDTHVSISGGTFLSDVFGGGDSDQAGVGGTSQVSVTGGVFNANVFGGGYATGGTSLVENAVITVGENFTLDGDIYAGGYANGGSVEVESARIVFEGSNIFSNSVHASGYGANNSVGEVSLSFDAYRGTFAGRLAGNFDGISISNDSSVRFTSADLSAALAAKSGLLNVVGDTSSYGSGSLDLLFVLSAGDSLIPDEVRVNGSALSAITEVTDYCYAWSDSTRDLWVVGADNIGDFAGYGFYTAA